MSIWTFGWQISHRKHMGAVFSLSYNMWPLYEDFANLLIIYIIFYGSYLLSHAMMDLYKNKGY